MEFQSLKLSNSLINNSNNDTLLHEEMVSTTGVLRHRIVPVMTSSSVSGVNNQILNNTNGVYQIMLL